jgi:hypothetical protein
MFCGLKVLWRGRKRLKKSSKLNCVNYGWSPREKCDSKDSSSQSQKLYIFK